MDWLFKKRTKSILNKFLDTNIILVAKGANFFGQTSKRLTQVRGNGVLVLTSEQLYFEMWTSRRKIAIPRKDIKAVEIAKAHLKKTKMVPLLKVIFTNDMGQEDSAAWWVKDIDAWIEKLKKRVA